MGLYDNLHEIEITKDNAPMKSCSLVMLKAATLTLFCCSTGLANEITDAQLKQFKDICDARLLPEEKISLWIYTGTTISVEEQNCMSRMAFKETRNIQNKNYFGKNQGDKQFRDLPINSLPIEVVGDVRLESITTENFQVTADSIMNELPIQTLRLPGYRSIK